MGQRGDCFGCSRVVDESQVRPRRSVLNGKYAKKLGVAVARFLFEVPDVPEGNYERLRTYLCTIQEGTAHPGTEPEIDDVHPIIREIGWFDLRQPGTWDPLLH
jgi:hypothetical protein